MKQFKVLKHPAGEIQAVKQGWCWPAFFFGCFWAMFARMWGLAFGVLIAFFAAAFVAAAFAGAMAADALLNIASIAVAILFGVSGNDWREKNLLSRGFEVQSTVSAENKDGAVALSINGASGVST